MCLAQMFSRNAGRQGYTPICFVVGLVAGSGVYSAADAGSALTLPIKVVFFLSELLFLFQIGSRHLTKPACPGADP